MEPTLDQINAYQDYLIAKNSVEFLREFVTEYKDEVLNLPLVSNNTEPRTDPLENFSKVTVEFASDYDGGEFNMYLNLVILSYQNSPDIIFDYIGDIEFICQSNNRFVLEALDEEIIVADIVKPFELQVVIPGNA